MERAVAREIVPGASHELSNVRAMSTQFIAGFGFKMINGLQFIRDASIKPEALHLQASKIAGLNILRALGQRSHGM